MTENDDAVPEQVGPAGLWTLWRNKRRSGEGMDSIIKNLRDEEAAQAPLLAGEAANDADPTRPTR